MANEELRALVDQMPEADSKGMYTTDIDKQKIEAAVAEIYQLGPGSVVPLIDMLAEPGSEADVKPRYALHCLMNHALVAGDDLGRRKRCEAVAGQLIGERPTHVKAFLCQELGWAGRGEVVPALGKLLTDPELSGAAAMALTAIRQGAAAELRSAWPQAQGAPRRHIMDALAALAEPASAKIFQAALADDDQEVRIAAAAGLSQCGQADAADALLKRADAAQGWERIQATDHCLALAERLAATGEKQASQRIYQHLQKTRTGKAEQHIREAAERGLASVG